jgi:hypothetical protein
MSIELANLKVGDEVPLAAVFREMWIPVFPVDGPPRMLKLTDVPAAAFMDT